MNPASAALWHWRTRVREPLVVASVASIVLHLMLLAIRFVPPVPIRMEPFDARLEVVLLNAQTAARPLKPQVLAQVNMEAGGDRDEGRARSPLPARSVVEEGSEPLPSQRRAAEIEQQQRRALALTRGPLAQAEATPEQRQPVESGAERAEVALAISRLQAQIDRQISDYNKRPKRLTFGVTARGVTYAQYVAGWTAQIERIGTERYPAEARGRVYDWLILTVEIDREGKVVDVVINKKSSHDVLNRAARQIVYAGAPYARFTPEMAREGDILQIVRAWHFTNEGLEMAAPK